MSSNSPSDEPANLEPTLGGEADTIVGGSTGIEEAPPLPSMIGRYRVLERLGAGGVGVVDLAYDPELDRRVALKRLRGARRAKDTQRILREARAVAQIAHPNVVAVHDVGMHEGSVYIAMEYVAGQDLGDWLKSHAREARSILQMMVQAGQGLAAAHAVGLVHRDFKPSNVLVGSDGRVRVLDFGLAKATEGPTTNSGEDKQDSGAPSPSSLDDLTDDGAVLGTPLYMAPEQHMARTVDHRADIFAFCVVLYEALSGKRPYAAQSYGQLVGMKGRRQYAPLDGVERSLRRVVESGLSPDLAERPQTMDEVLGALRRVTRPRWRGPAIGAATGVGVAAVAWAIVGSSFDCDRFDAAWDGVWDSEVRGRLLAGFDATDLDFAKAMGERTAEALDTYAADWIEQRKHLCEAPGDRKGRALVVAEVCMAARREEVARTVELLLRPDTDRVARAIETVRALPSIVDCTEGRTLATSEVVEAVSRRLADAHIDLIQGELARAEEALIEARKMAADGGYEAGRVDASIRLGSTYLVLDRADEAREILREVALDAETAGEDVRAARAYLELAFAVGVRGTDYEAARRWIEIAERKQQRKHGDAPRDPVVLQRTYAYRGMVEHNAGNYSAAETILRDGLDAMSHYDERAQLGRWAIVSNLGTALLSQGKAEEAVEAFETSIAEAETALGAGHPQLAETRASLATAYNGAGRNDEAIALLEVQIALIERNFGPHHPSLVGSLSNLASFYRTAERLEDARPLLERAEMLTKDDAAVKEAAMAVQVNLAGLELAEGKPRVALRRLERTEQTVLATWGPNYPHLANVYLKQVECRMALAEHDVALEMLRKTLPIIEQRLGPQHPYYGSALVQTGQLYLELGQPDDAKIHLETAIEVLGDGGRAELLEAAQRSLGEIGDASR